MMHVGQECPAGTKSGATVTPPPVADGVQQVRGLLMHGSKVDPSIVQLDQLRQPACNL